MQFKQENIEFYHNEFLNFNQTGVVAMEIDGWDDADGHITLWDGSNFLDYRKELNNNYLIGLNLKFYLKDVNEEIENIQARYFCVYGFSENKK